MNERAMCCSCMKVTKCSVVREAGRWAWYCLECGAMVDEEFIDEDDFVEGEKEPLEEGTEAKKPTKKERAALEILAQAESIEAAYRAESEKDFICFLRGIVIESQSGPKLFETCIKGFQRETFDDLAPALQALRDGEMPKMRRFWIERTKKASKDADLAVVMLWLICFPRRPFYAQVAAANKVQAAIVKERMQHLLHWNPWLNDLVEIIQWEVRSKKTLADGSPMAKMDIMSSDIAGAHGGTPNILIMNELSHVVRWEFVENLMDNARGVAQGLVIIATNAGFKGTKAEQWRNNAITSEDWCVHVLDRPAPWHDSATIREAKKLDGESRWWRLWMGKWQSGKGDAVTEDAIERCFRLAGPLDRPEPGWIYIGGLDLGISHDHSGFVILGANPKEQLIKTAYWKAWEPDPKTGEIFLPDVRETCYAMSRLFKLDRLFYDPHQAKLMAQELTQKGVRVVEMTFSTPSNLSKMATSFLQVIEGGKLECYDDDTGRLRRDFGKFNIVEKNYGYRLEAVADQYGHADVGTALVIALPASLDLLNGNLSLFTEEDVIVDVEEMGSGAREFSEEEVEALPKELRDIYGGEEEEKYAFRRRERMSPLDDIS